MTLHGHNEGLEYLLPTGWLKVIPPSEKDHGTIIFFQLGNLMDYCDCFRVSLEIFDMCQARLKSSLSVLDEYMLETSLNNLGDKRDRRETAMTNMRNATRWMGVAGRDGAVSLWNFLQALQSIKQCLDKMGFLRTLVKVGDVDDTIRELYKRVPNIKEIRDCVVHTSELTKTPRNLQENSQTTNFGTNYFSDCHFTVHGKKSRFQYELSELTLEILTSLTQRIYGCFQNTNPRST